MPCVGHLDPQRVRRPHLVVGDVVAHGESARGSVQSEGAVHVAVQQRPLQVVAVGVGGFAQARRGNRGADGQALIGADSHVGARGRVVLVLDEDREQRPAAERRLAVVRHRDVQRVLAGAALVVQYVPRHSDLTAARRHLERIIHVATGQREQDGVRLVSVGRDGLRADERVDRALLQHAEGGADDDGRVVHVPDVRHHHTYVPVDAVRDLDHQGVRRLLVKVQHLRLGQRQFAVVGDGEDALRVTGQHTVGEHRPGVFVGRTEHSSAEHVADFCVLGHVDSDVRQQRGLGDVRDVYQYRRAVVGGGLHAAPRADAGESGAFVGAVLLASPAIHGGDDLGVRRVGAVTRVPRPNPHAYFLVAIRRHHTTVVVPPLVPRFLRHTLRARNHRKTL